MVWSAIAFTLLSPLLTATGDATRSVAYPIKPVPLRELVEQADVIATVYVRETEMAVPPHELGYEIVELEVQQLLKGDPGRTTIRHVNNLRTVCPTPARFVPDTVALAFLERDPAGSTSGAPDGFFTLARSYGSKTLRMADLKLYVARVKEELAILAMPQGLERQVAQLEWLVRCAEQPATCWEGAYDLAPQGDDDADFYDERKSPFADALTFEQRQRLYAAYFVVDADDRGARCLKHLADADRDPRLLPWLVARLRSTKVAEDDERSFQTLRLIDQIALRDPRPEVAEIAKEFDRLAFLRRPEWDATHVAAEHRRLVTELLALFPQ